MSAATEHSDNVIETFRPEGWARPAGYSHGVIASGGRRLHIAGQLPWDPATETCVSDEFAAQWSQALANVAAVVRAAGGQPTDICELEIFITSMDEYDASRAQLGGPWGEHIGKHFPAVTMVQTPRLIDPDAKIEIRGVAELPLGGVADGR